MLSDDDSAFLTEVMTGTTNVRTNHTPEKVQILKASGTTFRCDFGDGDVRDLSRMDVGSPLNEDATESVFTHTLRFLRRQRPGVPDSRLEEVAMQIVSADHVQMQIYALNVKGMEMRNRLKEILKNNNTKAN